MGSTGMLGEGRLENRRVGWYTLEDKCPLEDNSSFSQNKSNKIEVFSGHETRKSAALS